MSARRPIGFSPQEISALVHGEVVSRHAEDAVFLWLRRDRAARAPNYKLADLIALDERVEAHVDGLRAAGATGWENAAQQLGLEGHGEVFAAAVLAFESGDEEKIALVLERGAMDPGGRHALASALAWGTREAMARRIVILLEGGPVEHRLVGLEAARILRHDPGPRLAVLLRESDPCLRARAARSAGELGRMDLLQELGPLLRDGDAGCRAAAARASALLGIRSPLVLSILRETALSDPADGPLSAQILVACIETGEALAWYRVLHAEPAHRRLALQVAGYIGDPVLVEDLIEAMGDVALSRVAGECFTRITGVDLAFNDLNGDAPEDYDDNTADDPDEPWMELPYDHDLPWPSRAAVKSWWDDHGGDFKAGRRYLSGKPLAPDALRECLETGTQPLRAAAALLLALQAPGRVMMQTTERGLRQLRSS